MDHHDSLASAGYHRCSSFPHLFLPLLLQFLQPVHGSTTLGGKIYRQGDKFPVVGAPRPPSCKS